jgi:enamine deaminase RidA (YjgF/YER057c/UK114 family)
VTATQGGPATGEATDGPTAGASDSTSRPDAPRPAGAYAVARAVGDLIHTAGMTPRRDGVLVSHGTLGETIDDGRGRELAALATERALDAATSILRTGQHLVEVISLTVFIAATPDYERHSSIADAASAVITDRMPAAPLPVRAAVGVASLPGGAPVEVQLIARFV